MKKIISWILLVFASGAVGYKIGHQTSKKKYEDIADKEIKSIRAMIEKRNAKPVTKIKQNAVTTDITESNNTPLDLTASLTTSKKPSGNTMIDYGKKYRTETDVERIPGNPGEHIKYLKKEEADGTGPYIIEADVFRDSEYECVTLFYCADKVLTDDDYNVLNDISIVGGKAILDLFDKGKVDCLYVRDDIKNTDYEILLEERTYSKIKPVGVVGED